MITKIEHIGIAVKDLAAAESAYQILLSVAPYKRETVESEGVITSFFQVGDSKIELLQSMEGRDTAISKSIEKRGEGIHHIAFQVENLEAEIDRLQKAGFRLISTEPKLGADNQRIVFLHPANHHGVLVELCQQIHTNNS